MRLTLDELELVRDSIFDYIEELEAQKMNDVNFTAQLAIVGDNRYIIVSFIVNIYEHESMFWIVSVGEIGENEYLDILSNQINSQK